MFRKERLYLNQLIKIVEDEVCNQREYYTDGNILAIEFLVNEAKKALDSHGSAPFIRSRQWINEEDINPVTFATEYYTRAGTYKIPKYGLNPATGWFKSTHIMNRLDESSSLAKQRAKDLLNLPTDGKVGSLDEDKKKLLEKALADMDSAFGEELGKATVRLLNTIRLAKGSRVVREQIENDANLFMSEIENEDFINRVKNDKVLSGQLDKFKKISDTYTLHQLKHLELMMVEDVDYEKLNKEYYIWNNTEKVITFVSPIDACHAKIKFILPPCENEQIGIGHVWIDNISVFPSEGLDWDIKNNGFEDGDGESADFWVSNPISGNPVTMREDKYPFCGDEKYSMMLKNNDASDCACLEHTEVIDIKGDVNNTLFFNGKIDGKFLIGLKFVIEYFDKEMEKVGEFEHIFNSKAMLKHSEFLLTCQADAIMYFFTKEHEYAEKVKYQIMYILNDFCQGAEHWMIFDSRPQGSDAYGAVQGGRVLCSIMSAYAFVKNADVFTYSEKQKMSDQLEYIFMYMLDLRDRTELSQHDMQAYSGNWQTDMASGVLFTTFAMPEMKNAPYWREISIEFLKSQLRENVGEDGSWPESIRYHFAALNRFAIVAKVVKNCIGEDWFKDECITNMFRFPLYMQTPMYEFFDNKPSTIPFGDHNLDSGECFAPIGIYCGEVARVDKKLAVQMYSVWQKAGMPFGKVWGEAVAFENLLAPGESFDAGDNNNFDLVSSGEFPDSGIYTFRKNFGVKGKESLFALMAPKIKIGHGHFDEGSFVIFFNDVPVVIDPCIEGYFDSTKDWYVSSSAHSTVMFARDGGPKLKPDPFDINLEKTEFSAVRGWNDTPRTANVIDYKTGDEMDEITVEVENSKGSGVHVRNVKYMRNEDTYIITDTTRDYDGEILFSLPLVAKSLEIKDNKASAECYYGIKAEIEFEGDIISINQEEGRCLKFFPCDGEPTAKYIRTVAKNSLKTIIKLKSE